MKRIQSKKHKLGTYEIDKISLSCFDDKRYVLDDEIHTLAYFHKNSVTSCKEIQKDCNKKERIEIGCDKKGLKKIVIKKGLKKTVKRLKKIVTKKRLKKIVKRLHVTNKMRSSGQFGTSSFFLRKDFTSTKSIKSTKTQPSKSTKSVKSTKTQPSKSTKSVKSITGTKSIKSIKSAKRI